MMSFSYFLCEIFAVCQKGKVQFVVVYYEKQGNKPFVRVK